MIVWAFRLRRRAKDKSSHSLVIGWGTLPYNILMRKHLLRLSAVRLLQGLDFCNTSWSFYIGLVGDLALAAFELAEKEIEAENAAEATEIAESRFGGDVYNMNIYDMGY